MIRGVYKGVAFDGCDGVYWIVGCRSAGTFQAMSELRRYIDDNMWACPRDAGG